MNLKNEVNSKPIQNRTHITNFGGIPYSAHGAQITRPTYFLVFIRLGKRFSYGPAGLKPPEGAIIRTKQKIKKGALFVRQDHNTG